MPRGKSGSTGTKVQVGSANVDDLGRERERSPKKDWRGVFVGYPGNPGLGPEEAGGLSRGKKKTVSRCSSTGVLYELGVTI